MTKTKIAFSIAAFFAVCLLSSTFCFAQTPQKNQAEPSYEVILQTVIGSNNAGNKADLSQSLTDAGKKLKANYSFTNYRLNSTFIQRVGNSGGIELRSVAMETLPNQEKSYSIFSDWSLNNLQSVPNANGQNQIQIDRFRFGQRVPIVSSVFSSESGKTNSVVNYEPVGVSLQRFSLPENMPTIVGTLSTMKPDELMFLILTVKPA